MNRPLVRPSPGPAIRGERERNPAVHEFEIARLAEGSTISRTTENTGFDCAHCGARVPPHTGGSYRNHCPTCLYSLHVDEAPGDRSADCGGLMTPVGIDHRPAKGFVVVHRCLTCGAVRRNRAAVGTVAPDDTDRLIDLMRR